MQEARRRKYPTKPAKKICVERWLLPSAEGLLDSQFVRSSNCQEH
jgi:hypothetical protein